jgi:hypothetical protein
VCDTYLPNLLGNKEETSIVNGQETFTNEAFRNTGIHSHDDGVIHWHPNSSRSTGNRATLGVFLDVYGVEVTDTTLSLPPDQVGPGEQSEWDTAEDTCADENGNEQETEMKLVVWPSYADEDDFTVYTTNFEDARIQNDGMVFTIAFVEKGKDVPVPPWAAELPELGAADGGAPLAPVGSSTVPGTDPATTDPATTDAPTTTGG